MHETKAWLVLSYFLKKKKIIKSVLLEVSAQALRTCTRGTVRICKTTLEGPFSSVRLGEEIKADPPNGLIELFPFSWGLEWKPRTPGPVSTSPPHVRIKKQPLLSPYIPVPFLLYSTCTILAKQVQDFVCWFCWLVL